MASAVAASLLLLLPAQEPRFLGEMYPAGGTCRGGALGDFDGDGRPDVVTNAGYDADPDDFVGVGSAMLGNGDGTFGPATPFATGHEPGSMALADFNRDGRIDLAVANFGHTPDYIGTFSVLPGNGDGTFGPRRDYDTGANPISIATADLNGDGFADVMTADYADDPDWDFLGHTISVFLGTGDGFFRAAPKAHVGENPAQVAVGDIDGNGTVDLLTPNWTQHMVTVLLGNGDGTFGSPSYGVSGHAREVAVADFNVDGHPDVAVASTSRVNWGVVGSLSILAGNGDGTFRSLSNVVSGTTVSHVATADFNGDGRSDIAYTYDNGTSWSSFIAVRLGNGNATFQPATICTTGSVPFGISVGDLDLDGHPDIVTPNYWDSSVSVLMGKGDGTFRAKVDYGTPYQQESVAIGDLNCDGRPDLATGGRSVSILLGNGDGTFGARSDIGGIGPVTIADLDADGRADLLVPRFAMLGNGDGTFGPPIDFGAYGPVTAADFDGDGRLDLAAAFDSFSGNITVLQGRGDGTFGARSWFGTQKYPEWASVADVNHDGAPDLVVPNLSSRSVSVMLNSRVPLHAKSHAIARSPGGSPSTSSARGPGEEPPPGLELAIGPRGAGRGLTVEFTLRDGTPARLELIDVAGRALASREVGAVGAGRHTFELAAGRWLPPGIYFLRLTQGHAQARSRVAVLR